MFPVTPDQMKGADDCYDELGGQRMFFYLDKQTLPQMVRPTFSFSQNEGPLSAPATSTTAQDYFSHSGTSAESTGETSNFKQLPGYQNIQPKSLAGARIGLKTKATHARSYSSDVRHRSGLSQSYTKEEYVKEEGFNRKNGPSENIFVEQSSAPSNMKNRNPGFHLPLDNLSLVNDLLTSLLKPPMSPYLGIDGSPYEDKANKQESFLYLGDNSKFYGHEDSTPSMNPPSTGSGGYFGGLEPSLVENDFPELLGGSTFNGGYINTLLPKIDSSSVNNNFYAFPDFQMSTFSDLTDLRVPNEDNEQVYNKSGDQQNWFPMQEKVAPPCDKFSSLGVLNAPYFQYIPPQHQEQHHQDHHQERQYQDHHHEHRHEHRHEHLHEHRQGHNQKLHREEQHEEQQHKEQHHPRQHQHHQQEQQQQQQPLLSPHLRLQQTFDRPPPHQTLCNQQFPTPSFKHNFNGGASNLEPEPSSNLRRLENNTVFAADDLDLIGVGALKYSEEKPVLGRKRNGVKGSACTVCKRFISRDMSRHMRIHDEHGRFRCVFSRETCKHRSGKFNRPYDYKKHLLNMHFKFDDPSMKLAPNLTGKLLVPGECVSCHQKFFGNDWLENHVLTTNVALLCPELRRLEKPGDATPVGQIDAGSDYNLSASEI